jgi:AcrR family transcriptional regulator
VPKVVDHDQRRAEIVVSARELIGERGADALTMRNLVERCGLANGALRRYFTFKYDVLLALDNDLSQRFKRFTEQEGYGSQRGLDAVRTVLNAVLPLDRERAISAEVFLALRSHARSETSPSASFQERTEGLFERVVKHLDEAHDDGHLNGSRSSKVTATILVNTAVGIGVTSSEGVERGLTAYHLAAIDAVIQSA